ncbi:MAG: SGNH/GDSL hydrolase family protein [Acidimicrobiales bacterium]
MTTALPAPGDKVLAAAAARPARSLLVASVLAAASVLGGCRTVPATTTDPTTAAAPATAASRASGGAPTTAAAPATAAAPSTTASPSTSAAPAAPAAAPPPAVAPTVLVVGDSLGEDLGFGLHHALAGVPGARLVQAAVGSSGLVEPQFYNWPQHLQAMLSQYHPRVVVVFLGANDVQNFYHGHTLETFGTPGWKAAYAKRVATMMQEATAAGARVCWVGMPIMRNHAFSGDMKLLNHIYAAEAAAHPGVTYLSSWRLFTTPSGRYTATALEANGQQIVLRQPDGIHIAPGGWDLLGHAVAAKIASLYRHR